MKRLLLSIVLFLSSFVLQAHPFHLSVCELEYNSETRHYEMAIKVFTDDFTKALLTHQDELSSLNVLDDNEQLEEVIADYIKTYFIITEAQQSLKLSYIGKEGDEDAVWLYFEAESISNDPKLEVKNMILFDQFDDQSNLLHYRCGLSNRSYMFQKSKIEQSVSCKE